MINRIKNTIQVLLGIKEAQYPIQKKEKAISFNDTPFSSEEQEFIDQTSMEFIFAEFGEDRVNAGGADLSGKSRLDPTLSSLKKYFPNATYTVYTDFDLQIEGVQTKRVVSPVKNEDNNPRFGHRTSVYFRFLGLLESHADFKCAIDSDMEVVSTDILSLVYLTQKFGFCVPYNARQLLRQDAKMSLDTHPITDESKGMGRAYNQTPMTLWKGCIDGEIYYKKGAELMKNSPARGSYIMWKAAWETGRFPYVLPKQFCVCTEDIGCGDEVILHVGHPAVEQYYHN
ncbi:hypothetical protein [Riemerella columbina]|uniref:hypothetical protein n=1 Tax=Riemerella columbina TaxID=103810 RepID=UPI002670908E|nr:hypothetical protein [Riemerella columbina]WKS95149.1 hypothetical protein NYR17_09590 [Riemerella columbina]